MVGNRIYGYTDRISVTPGGRVRFMVSCDGPERYRADIVRLINGDTNPAGPGFKEQEISSSVSGEYRGRFQPINAGSHVEIDAPPGTPGIPLAIHAFVMPTRPGAGPQAILARWDNQRRAGWALVIDENGCPALWLGDGSGKCEKIAAQNPLRAWTWYSIGASYDPESGRVMVRHEPVMNSVNSMLSPAIAIEPASQVTREGVRIACGADGAMILAGWRDGASGRAIVSGHFNGKIDAPRLYARVLAAGEIAALAHDEEIDPRGLVAAWNFAEGIGPNGIPADHVADVSGNGFHGRCVNMPVRAMTGHNWNGREENFTRAPSQYGAIHFHEDDVEDARWEPDFEWTVPPDLKSDVYAVRLRADGVEQHVPFFVRPPRGQTTAKIAFLAPTASYMAYANFKFAFEASVNQAIGGRTPTISADDVYLATHPEYGLAMYEVHSDFSGVCYSSRLHPILTMGPKYRGVGDLWQFPADLHLIDWLNAKNYRYDVITDEDLDAEGLDLIKSYKVVLTGTHPEYYSGAMLDAIEMYLSRGGRVMYLGGNGFYWVTTFHPHKRHVIEIRRGENGSRAWQARPGEYHHSTTGERGGLWRNRARPPQKLVGVGFTAEGFDVSSYYRRMPDSFDDRAKFIFEGVGDEELIGNFGLIGGGAAGNELDRYDLTLGTPPDAMLLATSEEHSDNYPRVVEEIMFMYPGQGGTQDPGVRADMVYFTTRNGGGVFSTGSIAWCGSLSHHNYDNNVSRIMGNVLNRFMSEEPLP